MASERIWKWGDSDPPEKNYGPAPPLFGSKSTISRYGERFCDGQYCLVSFLSAVLLLTVRPRAQPFVKVGVPPVPHGVGATVNKHTLPDTVSFA